MTNLETTYMGLTLRSPLVVAASPISAMIDRIKRVEDIGAGALVIRSLFEEQMNSRNVPVRSENFEDARVYYPDTESDAPSEYLHWVERARQAITMPLIASLNASKVGTWVQFAKQLEATGVDGLELNPYAVEANVERSAAEVESELYEIVEAVRAEVKIPVAVKLSPYYTSLANVALNLSRRGADSLVLFNRFLQPDIDIYAETLYSNMTLSNELEMLLPLRWTAILYGRIDSDIALTTGVHDGRDAVKAILAGAQVVQVATALLRNGIGYVEKMHQDIQMWMEEKGYTTLDGFRGKLSQERVEDPLAFERAQYVNLLLKQH